MPSNNTITEKRALDLVIKYERKQGRKPVDVRGKKGKHWDIESGNRLIEVKGIGGQRLDFWLTEYLSKFSKEESSRYYVYVVYNLDRKPCLKIIAPNEIFGNVEKVLMYWIRPGMVKKLGRDTDVSDLQ